MSGNYLSTNQTASVLKACPAWLKWFKYLQVHRNTSTHLWITGDTGGFSIFIRMNCSPWSEYHTNECQTLEEVTLRSLHIASFIKEATWFKCSCSSWRSMSESKEIWAFHALSHFSLSPKEASESLLLSFSSLGSGSNNIKHLDCVAEPIQERTESSATSKSLTQDEILLS